MRKILSSLFILLCFCLTIMGVGCSNKTSNPNNSESSDKTSNLNNSEDGGQSSVETITTLEGVWKSQEGKMGEHEKIVIEGTTIKVYRNIGSYQSYHDYELWWAGVYVPFTEPITEGSWTFHGNLEFGGDMQPVPHDMTFTYSNGELLCEMQPALSGEFQTVKFTKVTVTD